VLALATRRDLDPDHPVRFRRRRQADSPRQMSRRLATARTGRLSHPDRKRPITGLGRSRGVSPDRKPLALVYTAGERRDTPAVSCRCSSTSACPAWGPGCPRTPPGSGTGRRPTPLGGISPHLYRGRIRTAIPDTAGQGANTGPSGAMRRAPAGVRSGRLPRPPRRAVEPVGSRKD
jgi:hypothetical protein